MAFEDYSEIESFRISTHRDDQLRLLRRHTGSKKYELIAILNRGFLISRDYPTAESKLQEYLTIDLRYQTGIITVDQIENELIAVDIVKRNAQMKFHRYSVASETSFSFSSNLYIQTVNANFADRNEIVEP